MATTDYKTLSAELDQLINQLQSGELGIDEAIKAYEKGLKLVTQLEERLKLADNRIKELKPQLPDA